MKAERQMEQRDKAHSDVEAVSRHARAAQEFGRALGLTASTALDRLTREGEFRRLDAEKPVVRQGDEGHSIFIVLSGFLEVFFESEGNPDVPLGVLHEGDFFGEMGMLGDGMRMATVRTRSNCELLEVSKELFGRCIDDQGGMGQQAVEAIVSRLQQSSQRILKAQTAALEREARLDGRYQSALLLYEATRKRADVLERLGAFVAVLVTLTVSVAGVLGYNWGTQTLEAKQQAEEAKDEAETTNLAILETKKEIDAASSEVQTIKDEVMADAEEFDRVVEKAKRQSLIVNGLARLVPAPAPASGRDVLSRADDQGAARVLRESLNRIEYRLSKTQPGKVEDYSLELRSLVWIAPDKITQARALYLMLVNKLLRDQDFPQQGEFGVLYEQLADLTEGQVRQRQQAPDDTLMRAFQQLGDPSILDSYEKVRGIAPRPI